jgi:predicted nucleic acid-binding protein
LTVRATLDSNIVVYAELEPETPKGIRAQRVIEMSAPRGVIAAQALLEFVAVVRRRRIASLQSAISKVEAWSTVFEVAATTNLVAAKALTMVRDHQFQVSDAVIWSASREAGATLLLSEDLQDGLLLDGMRVVNPFVLNDADLASFFGV